MISLLGNRFSSRYGASILTASGCKDLVAKSEDHYIELAQNLANDTDKLTFYRNNLKQMTYDHGFSNVKRFAQTVEVAFHDMLHS